MESFMQFDRSNDPAPMTAACAVSRGRRLINWPVRILLFSGFGIAIAFGKESDLVAGIGMAAGFALAWFWWSYFIPKWRAWALQRGADPDELQALAVSEQLVWPKGSWFERTEFRRNGR
jgi:hypothetical protein